MKHIKLFIVLIISIAAITGCGSGEGDIVSSSKNMIDKDLSDNISINSCYYNKNENISYVKFYSSDHKEDDAIIMFDDNTIYYGSIYSTIVEDDYDKIIEYGDYTLCCFQIAAGGDGWEVVQISNK